MKRDNVMLEAIITVRYLADPEYYSDDNDDIDADEMARIDEASFKSGNLEIRDFIEDAIYEGETISVKVRPVQ